MCLGLMRTKGKRERERERKRERGRKRERESCPLTRKIKQSTYVLNIKESKNTRERERA